MNWNMPLSGITVTIMPSRQASIKSFKTAILIRILWWLTFSPINVFCHIMALRPGPFSYFVLTMNIFLIIPKKYYLQQPYHLTQIWQRQISGSPLVQCRCLWFLRIWILSQHIKNFICETSAKRLEVAKEKHFAS